MLFEQALETVAREQAHILGEHREQAAHQEGGDAAGAVAALLQRLRELREQRRDFACDFGSAPRGIERERIGPDRAQARLHLLAAQILHADAIVPHRPR
jgi:hypothetical protein